LQGANRRPTAAFRSKVNWPLTLCQQGSLSLFPYGEAAMRNCALVIMILVGLSNVDHIYYHDAILKPVYTMIWAHIHALRVT
jgi:hypothetical protein